MEKQPIKLGIIGAGLAVKLLHWPAIKDLAGCFEITAVADIVPENVEEIAAMGEKLNSEQGFDSEKVRRYSDYRELLREPNEAVEAVLLSLPIHLTAQILQDSWLAGKHIIAEKPIAANLEQGRQLVKAISGGGPIVEIAENYHYREDVRKIQEWVKAGAIGEVFLITLQALFWSDPTTGFASTPWRQDTQYRGGVFTDGGVHHAALLRELGGEVEQVQAFTKLVHPVMGGIDTVAMNLRYRSGVLGQLTFAGATRPPSPDYSNVAVYGTEGTITIVKDQTRLFRPDQPDETFKPEHSDYYWEFHNFYQAVRHGEPVVATPAEALKDLELVMLAFDSSELRQVILL